MCSACRATERMCESCFRMFKGHHRRCTTCRAPERACAGCGRTIKSHQSVCTPCRATNKACEDCGRIFTGAMRTCNACRNTERICQDCGREFRSASNLKCGPCRTVERTCEGCGCSFKGRQPLCWTCKITERVCEGCGRMFKGYHRKCNSCWWAAIPPEERAAGQRKRGNRRRARKAGAKVEGPVPAEVYAAIRASGPCVYCGDQAAHVDHVRPLARGGWEHESNLVPACRPCNSSKGDKLLTEWRPDRVTHGVACSFVVAAEWARLTVMQEGQVTGLFQVSSASRPAELATSFRVHGPWFTSKSRPNPTQDPLSRSDVAVRSIWIAP